MTGQINVNKIAARTGNTITVESGDVLQAPGHVLQVVQTVATTEESTTSTSLVNYTVGNVSITPSSTSSKVLVTLECNPQAFDTGDNGDMTVAIYKNGSILSVEKKLRCYGNGLSGTLIAGSLVINHLDSPSTTSQITYQTYFKKIQGGHHIKILNASITAMEIAG